MALQVTLDDDSLKKLRALRLWHWQQAMDARAREQAARSGLIAGDWEALDKLVGFHIGHVQTLNEFCPIRETAEHDLAALQKANNNG